MAKNIDFMGAVFPDVPSVKLPQQGGGLVAFDDTTDATATADKILQGYTAYANGQKLTGTASGGITPSGTISITQNGQVDVTNYATADVNVSGGGGNPLIIGALRPDAELVKSWTYDKWIVSDEGKTIPSYTTNTTTFIASSNLENVSLDTANYCYGVTTRTLTYPEYSETALLNGKFFVAVSNYFYEVMSLPQRLYPTDITPTEIYTNVAGNGSQTFLYYNSGIKQYNGSYGVYQTLSSPSLSSGVLTIKSPNLRITGSATYYKNTFMNATTDIRYQYIISLYRVPWDSMNIEGFNLSSMTTHMFDCLDSPSKPLT